MSAHPKAVEGQKLSSRALETCLLYDIVSVLMDVLSPDAQRTIADRVSQIADRKQEEEYERYD